MNPIKKRNVTIFQRRFLKEESLDKLPLILMCLFLISASPLLQLQVIFKKWNKNSREFQELIFKEIKRSKAEQIIYLGGISNDLTYRTFKEQKKKC